MEEKIQTDYTIYKPLPLVKEQNEVIDFLFNDYNSCNSLQTGSNRLG